MAKRFAELALPMLCLLLASHAVGQTLAWNQAIYGLAPGTDRCLGVACWTEGTQSAVYAVGEMQGSFNELAGSGYDGFIAKYDAVGGGLIWKRQFGSADNDRPLAVAVTAEGIWVVGWVSGSVLGQPGLGSADAFLARFDHASGDLLGIDVFGSAGHDEACGLAVDPQGITVVGWTSADLSDDPDPKLTSDDDGFIRRYVLAPGTPLGASPSWTRQEELERNQVNYSVAYGTFGGTGFLYIGSLNDVYFPGWNWAPEGSVTRRSLTDGAVLQEMHLPGGATAMVPLTLAPGADGVFVGGQAWRAGVFTVKLDPLTLAYAWQPRWIPGSFTGALYYYTGAAVVLDQGDILLTGGMDDGSGFAARCSASTGSLLQVRTFSTGDKVEPRAISAGDGWVYSAGSAYGRFGGFAQQWPPDLRKPDAFVLRFDVALSQETPTVIDEFGTEYKSGGEAAAADRDADGYVYVAGEVGGALPGQTPLGGTDAFLRKYDPTGALVPSFPSQFGTDHPDSARAVAVGEDAIYVAGRSNGVFSDEVTIVGGSVPGWDEWGVFVRKVTPAGAVSWTRRIYLPVPAQEHIEAIAVSGNDLYVVAYHVSLYVIHMDIDGNLVWQQTVSAFPSNVVRGYDAVADAGGVYITGLVEGGALPDETSFGFFDGFALKLAVADGHTEWSDQFGSQASDYGWSICLFGDHAYVGGGGDGSYFDPVHAGGGYDALVRKYDRNSGSVVWTRAFGSSTSDGCYGISADATGISVGGSTLGTLPGQTNAGGRDAFAARMSHEGDLLWVLQFGTDGQDMTQDMAADASAIYVTGRRDAPRVQEGFLAKVTSDAPPSADAGPDQPVHCGVIVNLDGSASCDDNTEPGGLGFSWRFLAVPPGSSASLYGSTTAWPYFVPDLVGDYVVELTVTDAVGQADTDEVVISSTNLAPTADAGTDVVTFVSSSVTLDGSRSSDPTDDSLTFGWLIIARPQGSTATLAGDTTPNPTLTPDLPGDYVVRLLVADHCQISEPDEVTVTVLTVADYAQARILDGAALAESLTIGQVTTAGNQMAFVEFLTIAVRKIAAGNAALARAKLQEALERTDGCVLRGTADGTGPGMDWILDCVAQQQVYLLLGDALAALAP